MGKNIRQTAKKPKLRMWSPCGLGPTIDDDRTEEKAGGGLDMGHVTGCRPSEALPLAKTGKYPASVFFRPIKNVPIVPPGRLSGGVFLSTNHKFLKEWPSAESCGSRMRY